MSETARLDGLLDGLRVMAIRDGNLATLTGADTALLLAHIDALQAVVDRLPKDATGRPIADGDTRYADLTGRFDGAGVEEIEFSTLQCCPSLGVLHVDYDKCYPTAAEAAKGGE